MKTKAIIYFSILGFSLLGNAQKKLHFEQIAFDYFQDSILRTQQIKNDVTISLKAVEDRKYWNVDCLKELDLNINDTAAAIISAIGETKKLKIENDKRFKIKVFRKNNNPEIFVIKFLTFTADKNITGIVENTNGEMITYLFEINNEGIIKKWCKGKPLKPAANRR